MRISGVGFVSLIWLTKTRNVRVAVGIGRAPDSVENVWRNVCHSISSSQSRLRLTFTRQTSTQGPSGQTARSRQL